VCGHRLGVFERPAILQIRGQAIAFLELAEVADVAASAKRPKC
jgi:hypothetical protein